MGRQGWVLQQEDQEHHYLQRVPQQEQALETNRNTLPHERLQCLRSELLLGAWAARLCTGLGPMRLLGPREQGNGHSPL